MRKFIKEKLPHTGISHAKLNLWWVWFLGIATQIIITTAKKNLRASRAIPRKIAPSKISRYTTHSGYPKLNTKTAHFVLYTTHTHTHKPTHNPITLSLLR